MTPSERGAAADIRAVAVQGLVVSVALIGFAWMPPMPVAGAQLSDAIGAVSIGVLLLALSWSRVVDVLAGMRVALGALVVYALWSALAYAASGGSWAPVAGSWWLVVLAVGVCAAASESAETAAKIRKALVIAAVVSAVAGLIGAVLFFAGSKTALLNHEGDLVPGNYPRIRGTLPRANGLAGLIGVALFFVGDLEARWRKPAYAVLLVALAFTFSRTWLALAGTVAVVHFALGPRRRDGLAVVAAVATVAVMLAVSWAQVTFDPSHPWRIAISSEPGSRWPLVENSWAAIREHPVFGIGPGRPAAGYRQAHFTLLNIAAQVGIPAALAFLVGMGAAARVAWKRARAGDIASRALVSSFVLVAFDALARDVEDQRPLWIVVGLALVSLRRR